MEGLKNINKIASDFDLQPLEVGKAEELKELTPHTKKKIAALRRRYIKQVLNTLRIERVRGEKYLTFMATATMPDTEKLKKDIERLFA